MSSIAPTARCALSVLVSLLLPVTAAADPPRESPRFTRTLTPSAKGPTRADVDVALLAGAAEGGRLQDLRIAGPDGVDVPYLLIEPDPRQAPTWVGGTTLPIVATAKNESGFELDLKRVVPIDRLRLGGLPRPFLKQARVEGSGDHARYTVLAPAVTVFDLPEEDLTSLEIPLPATEVRYVRVVWDDHATTTLPVPAVALARELTPTSAAKPLRGEVTFERRPSRAGESVFRVHLPAEGMPIVALEVDARGNNLLRAARVTEPLLQGSQVSPVERGHATLRRSARDGLYASALQIPVSHVKGPDVDLVVDDGDNPPFDLVTVSAVYAPQPWIYLEPKDTSPLVARYGDPKAAAPRYDLEAARAGLDRVHPALAAWGAPRPSSTPRPAEAPDRDATTGAALEALGFAESRPITFAKTEQAGLAALRLDAAVLAKSATLADVRIRSESGRQVPYLVEQEDEPILVDLHPERIDKPEPGEPPLVPKTTVYRVTLPYTTLPAGRLVLTTGARVFQRRVTLLAPRPVDASPREPDFRALASRDWTHADASRPASPLALSVSLGGTGVVFVRVDEGDNEAIPIAEAHYELPGVQLRFFHATDEKLTLVYGKPSLEAPRYDLALLAPTLSGAIAEDAQLGPVIPLAESTPPSTRGMPAFWVALMAAVAVLVAMMVGLLRRQGTAD